MSMPKLKGKQLRTCATLLFLSATSTSLAADTPSAPRLGKAMTAEEVARWDLTIFPDGTGLPDGAGTAKEGEILYNNQCRHCHGNNGQGATAEELAAPQEPLTSPYASKAIGPYWPFATTLFDFIRRAMPPTAPGSLSANDVYALTAYLLAANGIVAKDQPLDAKSLAKVEMPNRNGFIWIDAPH